MSSAQPAGFELSPPGSFSLCADPERQAEAASELLAVSEQVRADTRRYSALGLILTGSFARGEATILVDPEGGIRWLSDIECLVVFPADKQRAPIGEVDQVLRGIESERNLRASNMGSGIKLELRSIQAPRLARLRPAIFSRELLEHGKLLWGEPAALPLPRWYPQAGSEIPAADGFRLLNNRIMEQLAVRLNDERGSEDRISRSYWLSKFWIDLATSLSIFLHCYVTTYLGRQASIEKTLAARPELFGDSFGPLFVTRLKESMAIKVGKLSAFNSYSASLNEAASAAAQVWGWESDQLAGRSFGGGDWRSIVSRLRRAETASQRIRDWARLLLRRGRSGSRATCIKAALRAGSLANAIYGAGCLLDFYWDEIGSETSPGPEVALKVGELLGVDAGGGEGLRERLVAAALDAWTVHLRFAAG